MKRYIYRISIYANIVAGSALMLFTIASYLLDNGEMLSYYLLTMLALIAFTLTHVNLIFILDVEDVVENIEGKIDGDS